MTASYFNIVARRNALSLWAERNLKGTLMNATEIRREAKDIFTPLYGVNEDAKCRRDIKRLVKEGVLEDRSGQYRCLR